MLKGRDREFSVVRGLLDEARERRGAALLVLGDSGLGKSALLNALAASATGFLVLDTSGNEPESALNLAGLHRLLQPLARRIASLPGHDADALSDVLAARVADGAVDEFVLGSAVHRLLSEVGKGRPVLCWVDDVHRLDRISLAALAFVARRLSGERIVMVFAGQPGPAVDGPGDLLAGIPVLRLEPLNQVACTAILADRFPHGLPADLSAEIVDLASGNPLALVELAGSLTPEQLSGQAPAPVTLPRHSRQREVLMRRFTRLSDDGRRVVMMAVVDEHLDVDTVLRAATSVGVDLRAYDEAIDSGLVRADGEAVVVPTRLVRAVLYAEAPLVERRAAHGLLANVLDPQRDRLRWAWHRATAAGVDSGPLADELVAAATSARGRGDYATASTAHQRAAALTGLPDVRGKRLINAARDSWLAGRTQRSRMLLRQAVPLAETPGTRGFVELLDGVIELRGGMPRMAAQSLIDAADRLVGIDRTHAFTALMLAGEANCVIGDYPSFFNIARRAVALRRPDETPVVSIILDHFAGMAATYQGRHYDAVLPLRHVVRRADAINDVTSKILGSQAAYALGNVSAAFDLATQAVSGARSKGLLALVPWARAYVSMSAMLLDQYSTANASSLEGLREAQAIGQPNSAVDHLTILALVAALQGDHETAQLRFDAATEWTAAHGLGRPGTLSSWAMAAADLAHDRAADAMDRLSLMAAGAGRAHMAVRVIATPHLVEAAVRNHRRDLAIRALATFDRWVGDSGCAPRLALSRRCHGLLATRKSDADEHFRAAIELHRRSGTAFGLAKTELFYAYQLRRDRKPMAARELLRDSAKIFASYDAEQWAARARAELRAAGESIQPDAGKVSGDLTAQQMQISRLVAEGATNREIAGQLFISHRTVDHHLRNIFTKLGVRSRVELAALFH